MVMSGQERMTSSSALVDDYNSACVDMLMSYMCHTHVRVSFSRGNIIPPPPKSNIHVYYMCIYGIYIDSSYTL